MQSRNDTKGQGGLTMTLRMRRRTRLWLRRLDRKTRDAELRVRCRVLLKVAAGKTRNAAAREVGCVPSTAVCIVARFEAQGGSRAAGRSERERTAQGGRRRHGRNLQDPGAEPAQLRLSAPDLDARAARAGDPAGAAGR